DDGCGGVVREGNGLIGMRERLAALNPTASAKIANRLIEAQQRNYWQPDAATLDALRLAGEELEDRLEGLDMGVAA
ncbi:MAG TPA: cobaltochelatase subunit CobN, partial [Acetobacteraceae bacterium]|nr:cobaltochelatase subunit CobN [Acetobacteraceae bacterium]